MLNIQLSATPSQTLQTQVDNQPVVMNIYQKSRGLFADIVANGETVVTGVICLNAVPMIPTDYLGFAGNFIFIDTQGTNDPDYTGLGERFKLIYLTEAEYGLI